MKKTIALIVLFFVSCFSFSVSFANSGTSVEEVSAANFLFDQGLIANYVLENLGISVESIESQIRSDLDNNIETDHDLLTSVVEAFRLNDRITRQEVMKIIAKLSGETIIDSCRGSFSDVDQSGWGCKYIEWALDKGYIAQNEKFRPEEYITKTEAMKLVLGVKGVEKSQETDDWRADYMETAFQYGIIDEGYTDFDATALRGWLFNITTSTIKKEEEIKEIQEEKNELISDEAL